eukprot:GHVT01024911.1.p1 GENE.GHVT01024911.1~~GHVT01024911.1.p1  ORF type:complete len:198 (-),score=25.15 GHVT01024911.1:286-879(-)
MPSHSLQPIHFLPVAFVLGLAAATFVLKAKPSKRRVPCNATKPMLDGPTPAVSAGHRLRHSPRTLVGPSQAASGPDLGNATAWLRENVDECLVEYQKLGQTSSRRLGPARLSSRGPICFVAFSLVGLSFFLAGVKSDSPLDLNVHLQANLLKRIGSLIILAGIMLGFKPHLENWIAQHTNQGTVDGQIDTKPKDEQI